MADQPPPAAMAPPVDLRPPVPLLRLPPYLDTPALVDGPSSKSSGRLLGDLLHDALAAVDSEKDLLLLVPRTTCLVSEMRRLSARIDRGPYPHLGEFLLQGRFIFGPDVRSLFLTMFLILAPVLVFCIFVASHLINDFPDHWGISVMVVVVVFTVYDLTLLLLTSGRDPSIVPRNTHPPKPEPSDLNNDTGNGQTPQQLRLPRTKDVYVNGVIVKVKYCDHHLVALHGRLCVLLHLGRATSLEL